MSIVKLEDFFDFESKKPINRLAYTKEDCDYKIKVINKMQELGMTITIDKVGNICGSISLGNNPKKTLAIGSHTDSVYDGGQYDGPVGVINGLQVAENLIRSRKCNGVLKVAIYACEESSRFGNACIGSKYLNGNLKEEDFNQIIEQERETSNNKETNNKDCITLKKAINNYKTYILENVKGIKEVDKIFEKVDYSLESHIEQYEILHKKSKGLFSKKDVIGIVNSVGSAVRVKYNVKGQAGHTGATPMGKRKNAVDATSYIGKDVKSLGRSFEIKGLGRASQVEVNTPGHKGSFNQIPEQAEGKIDFRLLGKNNPEKVLHKFNKIRKSVEKKTRTIIGYKIISKGSPTITSKKLNHGIADVCDSRKIKYLKMPSYAGQDTGYIPAKEKTMIFIPSTGGSHNPDESTKKRFIELATNVFTDFSKELLKERMQDKYAVRVTPKQYIEYRKQTMKTADKGIERR